MDSLKRDKWNRLTLKYYSSLILMTALVTTLLSLLGLIGTVYAAINIKMDITGSSVLLDFINTIGFWLIIIIGVPIAGITYLFLAGIVSGLLALPGALFWQQSKQFVVLRRFQRDDASKTLQRVLKEYVAPYGHIYTLADRDVKISWLIRYPILLTQFAYFHFRPRYIQSPRDIRKLLQAMNMRWLRNINWFVSWNKVFAVDSTDNSWEQCVRSMCEISDVIICDISERSPHIEWEVNQIITSQWLDKTLFLTSNNTQQGSLEFLQSLGINSIQSEDTLYLYDNESDNLSLNQRLQTIFTRSQKEGTYVVPGIGAWASAISQIIGPFIWITLLLLLCLPLGQDLYLHYQNDANIAIIENELSTEDKQTKGLLKLNKALTNAAPYTEQNPAQPQFESLLENRIYNLYAILEKKAIINDRWLKQYDHRLVPILIDLQGKNANWDILITDIIEQTKRPSIIPLWIGNIEQYFITENTEIFYKSLKAMQEPNTLNPTQVNRVIDLLTQLLNIHLQREDITAKNTAVTHQILYTLILLNVPKATKSVINFCGADRQFEKCTDLDPLYALHLLDLLVNAWDSSHYDRDYLLVTLRNLGLSGAKEIWREVIENTYAKYTKQQVTLAAEGAAKVELNEFAPLLVNLVSNVFIVDTYNSADVDFTKRIINSLGRLHSDSILPFLYSILHNEGEFASQAQSAVITALETQLLPISGDYLGKHETQKTSKKPTIIVGTIGQVDHGKTTLTAAITKVMDAKFPPEKNIVLPSPKPVEQTRGITIKTSHVNYESATKQYKHIDAPGHMDFVKNLIFETNSMEGAILVVAADKGPQPQTREHIKLISDVGVKHVVVYLNKMDLMPDLEKVELVEMEIMALLEEYGYSDYEVPIIRGSALLSLEGDKSEFGEPSIIKLVKAMDNHIPPPKPLLQLPFKMSVEGVGRLTDSTQLVAGRIESGQIKVGSQVEVVGLAPTWQTRIREIIPLRFSSENYQAGDSLALLIETTEKHHAERGQLLSAPKSSAAHSKFEAKIYILNKAEGGRHTAFFRGYQPQFQFRTVEFEGSLEFPSGLESVLPGDDLTVWVTLERPVAMEEGLHFNIREGGRTVGAGYVVKIIE